MSLLFFHLLRLIIFQNAIDLKLKICYTFRSLFYILDTHRFDLVWFIRNLSRTFLSNICWCMLYGIKVLHQNATHSIRNYIENRIYLWNFRSVYLSQRDIIIRSFSRHKDYTCLANKNQLIWWNSLMIKNVYPYAKYVPWCV